MKRFIFILTMAVALIGGTVSAYASESLPPLPGTPVEYEHLTYYIVYKDSGNNYQVLYTDKEMIVSDTWIKANVAPFTHYTYMLSNDNWNFRSTNTGTATGNVVTFKTIVDSNYDIYDNKGELVFQKPLIPLAEEIRAITAETLEVETQELSQTVLVVVLCGVGCLALVTSLVLLRKVLPNFLN